MTLYAVWSANSYTVTYDGNGSTGGSVPSAQVQNYNTTVTVQAASATTCDDTLPRMRRTAELARAPITMSSRKSDGDRPFTNRPRF